MAKIDEIKEQISWHKDLFKILVAVLVAIVAGISKLYLSGSINVLFYLGSFICLGFTVWISIIAKKIKQDIRQLKDL